MFHHSHLSCPLHLTFSTACAHVDAWACSSPWALKEMDLARFVGPESLFGQTGGGEREVGRRVWGHCHRARCYYCWRHLCWYQPQVNCDRGRIYMRPKMLPQSLLLRTRVPLGVPFPLPSPPGLTLALGAIDVSEWGNQVSAPRSIQKSSKQFSSTYYVLGTLLMSLTWFP